MQRFVCFFWLVGYDLFNLVCLGWLVCIGLIVHTGTLEERPELAACCIICYRISKTNKR